MDICVRQFICTNFSLCIHYRKRQMHQGVMTQAMLAVKQWHMAKVHNIKHFGDCASLVPK